MKIWVDAQLSPVIAVWITDHFAEIEASCVRDLGLRDEEDSVIFLAAKAADAIVMTKDSNFVNLQFQLGAPPKIIWITCGNTSNKRLKEILIANLVEAMNLLETGSAMVEISGL